MIHAGDGADVDADARGVRHRVHRVAPSMVPTLRVGLPMTRGGPVSKIEIVRGWQSLWPPCRWRSHRARASTVRGHALEARVELERALVADQRVVRGRLADHHRTRSPSSWVLASCAEPTQPPSSAAVSTMTTPGVPASCREAARRDRNAATPDFMSERRGRRACRRRLRRRTGPCSTAREPSGTTSRWPVRQSGDSCPDRRARATTLVRLSGVFEGLDVENPIPSAAAGHVGAIALAAGRVDGVEAKEIAGQRNSVLVGHGGIIASPSKEQPCPKRTG